MCFYATRSRNFCFGPHLGAPIERRSFAGLTFRPTPCFLIPPPTYQPSRKLTGDEDAPSVYSPSRTSRNPSGFLSLSHAKTPPIFRGLRVAATSPGGSPRQTLATACCEALDKSRHRYSPLQLWGSHRDYVAHSAAEEVFQDLNKSTPERRRWFRCRRNVVCILKPTPEI
jgi:hypothetical protein